MSNLSTLFDRYKALVVFDTETSGLDFDNDQIIELAALRVERTATGGLRIAGKMDTFIKLPEGETLPGEHRQPDRHHRRAAPDRGCAACQGGQPDRQAHAERPDPDDRPQCAV